MVVGWGGGEVGEKLGIKLKLSFSWGLELAELGNNYSQDQLSMGGSKDDIFIDQY